MDNNIKKFFEFIYERQLIWHKKEVLKEQAPWTEDRVLQKYLFCNVYRELDKGTKYLIKRVINNEALKLKDILFNIIIYRFFNKNMLFDDIFNDVLLTENFNFKENEALLDKRIAEGKSLFSSAYLISQVPFDKTYRWGEKHIQVLMLLEYVAKNINDLHEKIIIMPSSAKDSFEEIKKIYLCGAFMSYEIYCDLTYTNLYGFSENDFVNVGPGAVWGLDLMFPNNQKNYVELCHKLKESQKYYWLQLVKEDKDWVEIAYTNSFYPELSLRGIEHSLCEYRKYLNLKTYLNGGKRCKLRYYRPSK